ncbi:MAG: hypothetical protein ACYCUX_01035 [Metallibacterium sp.]
MRQTLKQRAVEIEAAAERQRAELGAVHQQAADLAQRPRTPCWRSSSREQLHSRRWSMICIARWPPRTPKSRACAWMPSKIEAQWTAAVAEQKAAPD